MTRNSMRLAGGLFILVASIIGAMAQTPASRKADPYREMFEKDIQTVALERGFESDAPMLIYALKLRQTDEAGFMAGMKVLGQRGKDLKVRQCEKLKSRELCAFAVGAYLEVVGKPELGWEYARIAKAFADKTPGLDPADVADTYSRLAKFERKAGLVGKANELERLAKQILAGAGAKPAPAITNPRTVAAEKPVAEYVRLAATTGRVAALRLAAAQTLGPEAPKPTGRTPDPSGEALVFIADHLVDIFTNPELQDVKTRVTTGLVARMNELPGYASRVMVAALLDAHHALPKSLLDAIAAETRRHATANQDLNRAVNRLENAYAARSKYAREQAYLFCSRFTHECLTNGVPVHRALSQLLKAQDAAQRTKAFKELVEIKRNEGMGLTDANDVDGFLAGLDAGRAFGVLIGEPWLARAFASEYLAQAQKLATGSATEAAQQRIGALLPNYLWLSRDALARGQRGEAVKLVSEAERIVVTRLTREWRSGGVKAAETLLVLRSHLRELADVRSALYPTAQPQDALRAAELAFAAMQYPQIAEIALEILANAQKRAAGSADLVKALAVREELGAELARVDTLATEKLAYQKPGQAAAAKVAIGEKIKAVEVRIKAASPAGTATTSLDPLPLANLMALLRQGEVLVSSVVAEERTSFAMLAGGQAYLWQVPLGRAELTARIAELRRSIDAKQAKFPLQAAHRLFVDLLGPVREQLLAADHALLAVDGPLLGLPFQLLLTEPPPTADLSAGDYRKAKLAWLARGPALSIVPSLRAIEALRKAPVSKATLRFAGIGDPVLVGKPGEQRGVTVARLIGTRGQVDPKQVQRLPPLPETADELSKVSKAVGGRQEDIFLKEKATEAALKRANLRQYRVISFATHGLMAGDLSGLLEPALVLSPPNQPTQLDDGLLTTSEIAALKLDTELVNLSACNTAAADGTPQAEGLSGLTRAFFAAGSRGVIASHWTVSSEATVLLMTRAAAFQSSNAQMSWSKSLRAAMIDLIDNQGDAINAHPYYWAPFVAVGAG